MTLPERLERTATEWANALTHGLGLVLSLVGAAVLVVLAVLAGSPRLVLAVGVFGAALVLLYAASTCYHWVCRVRLKERLRVLDHVAILYLIAGSYTPFALVSVRGVWGYTMLVLIWALALYGTYFKLFSRHRYSGHATWLYVGMGWLAVLFAGPMIAAVPWGGLGWLALGGLAYTGGIAFFALDARHRWAHPVWHLFVLAGSACHFVAVLRYVVPAGA